MPKMVYSEPNRTYVPRFDPTGIEEVLSLAFARWGWEPRYTSRKEASGPCPLLCNGGDDRFVLFEDGGYWCRQCGSTGWVTDSDKPMSLDELTNRRLAALERKQAETDVRVSALERIARRTEQVDHYHAALNEQALVWWHDVQGVSYPSIHDYKLGYCQSCPTAPGRESYTIPYWQGGSLINIRHRLAEPVGGKYRPEMPDLGIALFQADILDESLPRITLVEGEIKAIVLTQVGIPAVGIMGKRSFDDTWVARFAKVPEVVIALDPDADDAAESLARTFHDQEYPGKVRVARMPGKPDDLIVKHGGTRADIDEFLELAKPV